MTIPPVITGAGLVGIVILVGIVVFWKWNTRRTMAGVAIPTDLNVPDGEFSHDVFAKLLQRFVHTDGYVTYQAWYEDADARVALDAYLGTVAAYSPDNAPERFSTKSSAQVYWLTVYNALVIKAVLDRWPLDTVTDVKAPVELTRGMGFFYTLEFIVGGVSYNLYDLEHKKVLNASKDPRAHFFLNCGSKGCPAMRPTLPTGQNLDDYLDEATRDFIGNPDNVRVDHANQAIYLSRIFKWYSSDFVNYLAREHRDTSRGVVDYIALAGPLRVRDEIAKADGYRVRYRDYDWSINASDTNDHQSNGRQSLGRQSLGPVDPSGD